MRRYRQRVSGPLWDRIDLHVTLTPVRFGELRGEPGASSAEVRERVMAARAFTQARMRPRSRAGDAAQVRVTGAADRLLRRAVDDFGFSARAHDRLLRLARTIADLAARADVDEAHVAEAMGFRGVDGA